MPGISRVETIRLREAVANDEPVTCVVREFSSSAALPWQLSSGEEKRVRKALQDRQIVVSSVLARRLALHEGDAMRLEVSGQVYSVGVAAIVSDYMLGGQAVFLDRTAAERLFELAAPQYFLLTRAADAPVGLEDGLKKYAASHGYLLQSFADLRSRLDGLINGVVGSLFVLMAIGFVVGGLGVSNTLSMGVLEQTRELGLLRIVGMTRGQVRRLILVEGMLIGSIGILLGTFGGATTAYTIHACNWALLGHHVAFAVHGWLLSLSILGCLAVTLAAAWIPARHASQINLLTAIAYE
jgi:putative ABC transport system permease protein